jgi:hypothetical protein
MTLPADLKKFKGLIDLVVEQIVREIIADAENKRAIAGEPMQQPPSIAACRPEPKK